MTESRHAAGDDVPPHLVRLLRGEIPRVAAEVLREIQRCVPAYSLPLEGVFGRTITDGIERTLLQFVDRLAAPQQSTEDQNKLFRMLGKLEVSAGRSIDVLQTAYRVGARVAWRRMAELGQRADLPVSTMCRLAEAVFEYIDEISALSIEGYSLAQARAAGARERRRRQLLAAVLAKPAPPTALVAELAAAAGWAVPDQVVAVALARRTEQPGRPTPSLPDEVLVDFESAEPCLLLAGDVNQHLAALRRELADWRAAIGPRVALSSAHESLRWARRTLALAGQGLIRDEPIVDCDDHLATLWLLSDSLAARALAEQALAPLLRLTGKQRARLGETLAVWLETRGSAQDIASRLDVHPQTVRYRLRQLDELFGARLADPDACFDMAVALRALRLSEPGQALPEQQVDRAMAS